MLNKAILVGRITADPELRQTPNGVNVTTFTIACNRSYSKGNERQADFIDIVCWRQQAEFVTRYFRKGNAIAIDGSIQVRDYTDKNGNKRRVYEIVADNVHFVESKNAGAQSGSASGSPSPSPSYDAPAEQPGVSYSNGDFSDFAEIEPDDDLPF